MNLALLAGGGFVVKLLSDADDIEAAARPFQLWIDQAARRHGVGRSVLTALLWQESRFRVPTPVGAAGEIGLGQFLPGAAADVGYTIAELADNQDRQIDAAAAFLSLQLRRAGSSLLLGLRSYNAGFAGAKSNPAAGLGYALDVLKNAVALELYGLLRGGAHA